MTINKLNAELKNALIKYLKVRNHVESGELNKSIVFTCTDTKKLNVKFKSLMYIQFLDDGKFVGDFMALQTTKNLITKYITKKLVKDVKDIQVK